MNEHLTAIFVLVLSSSVGSEEQAPLVTIPDGQIQGMSGLTGVENRKYYGYRGIPFAKPPLGDLRFAAPVKNDPWNGTLDATNEQESCVQMDSSLVIGASGVQIAGSEDCLYINVYTTDVDGRLPVMVWIYGGGFISGTSKAERYSPDNFLEKDVVFVSFNYRLGVFGFLSTEDENASGNWGIKDQVMALRWVKDNIKYFGGDPNKITIFGQSAGGASVSYLAQTNMTNGLFDRAIMQSGTSLCLWALSNNARTKAFHVGLRLGIFTLSSKSLIKNLRKANYRDLKLAENNVTLQAILTDNILAGLPFGVVTEPNIPGAVFSKKSWELLSTGQFQRVPSIIGYTSNEAAALTAYVGGEVLGNFGFMKEGYPGLRTAGGYRYCMESSPMQGPAWVAQLLSCFDSVFTVAPNLLRPVLIQYELDVTRLAPYDLTRNVLKRLAAGTEIRRHYIGLFGSLSSQPDALTRFVNVDQFNRPIRETVNQASKFTTVYYYQFSYSGLLGNPNQTHEGVGHAEELPYLFYTKNRVPNGSDFMVSQRFVTLWTNFAKTGNPTPESDSENDNLLSGITWEPNNPTINSAASIKYLNINNSLTMESNPFQDDWNFYQGIYDRYGDPPYTTY